MFSSLTLRVGLVLALLLGAPYALAIVTPQTLLPVVSTAGISAAASQVTVSFQNGVSPNSSYSSGDDAYLSQSNATTGYGAAMSCNADGDEPAGSTQDVSCLLRWDVTSIPAGSTVTAASITLNIINTSVNSYPVYQILRSWSESGATWDAYASGLSWGTPGALASSDRGTASLGVVDASATGPRTFNLNSAGIAMVQSWINTPASNQGIIVADSSMTDGVDFSSNEVGTASQRPALTIQYAPASTAPTATAPAATATQPVPTATPTSAATSAVAPTATAKQTSKATPTPTKTPTRAATATLAPTATPTRAATATAVQPTPSAGCSLLGQPTGGPYCFGILGSDSTRNTSEYGAGLRYKLFTIRWAQFSPSEGMIDSSYVSRKQSELSSLRAAGLTPILSLGLHDPPDWLHTNYPDSYYVDQYGDKYTDGLDTGDVNLIFNPTMRSLANAYLKSLFSAFGTNFAAVRLGGGRYGELTYPPASFNGKSNLYWNYDANALAKSPYPNWHPGDPSPSGQANAFLRWHLDALTEFQNWQITSIRQLGYQGPLMMLYPSWGIRPGDYDKAVATNLNGSSSAETNGEIQRGFDFQSQISSISDPKVIVTCTWMDADASRDSGTDQRYWSPVHYLSYLAHAHPLGLSAFAENTGHGSRSVMDLSASQMKTYRLTGMMWYNETEMFSGSYATLTDYQQVIASYNR